MPPQTIDLHQVMNDLITRIDPTAAAGARAVTEYLRLPPEVRETAAAVELPNLNPAVAAQAQQLMRLSGTPALDTNAVLTAAAASSPALAGLPAEGQNGLGAVLAQNPGLTDSITNCFPTDSGSISSEAVLSGLMSAATAMLPPQVQAAMQMAQITAQAVDQIIAAINFPSHAPNGSGFIVEGQEVACALDPTAPDHAATPLLPGKGCTKVAYNGRPVWRAGLDISKCAAPIVPPHPPGYVQDAAKKTLVGGQAVARKTDIVQEGTPRKKVIKGPPKLSSKLPSTAALTLESMINGAVSRVADAALQSVAAPWLTPTPTPTPSRTPDQSAGAAPPSPTPNPVPAPTPTPGQNPAPSAPGPTPMPTPTPDPVPGPTPASSAESVTPQEESLIDSIVEGFKLLPKAIWPLIKSSIAKAIEDALTTFAAVMAANKSVGNPFGIGGAAIVAGGVGIEAFIKEFFLKGLTDAAGTYGILTPEQREDAYKLANTLTDIIDLIDLGKKAKAYRDAAEAAAKKYKPFGPQSLGGDEWLSPEQLKKALRELERETEELAQKVAHKELKEYLRARNEQIINAVKKIHEKLTDPGPVGIPNQITLGQTGAPGGDASQTDPAVSKEAPDPQSDKASEESTGTKKSSQQGRKGSSSEPKKTENPSSDKPPIDQPEQQAPLPKQEREQDFTSSDGQPLDPGTGKDERQTYDLPAPDTDRAPNTDRDYRQKEFGESPIDSERQRVESDAKAGKQADYKEVIRPDTGEKAFIAAYPDRAVVMQRHPDGTYSRTETTDPREIEAVRKQIKP